MESADASWWQELRAEFPYLQDHVFAWSGGQVPIANSVRDSINRVMAAWDDNPVTLATSEWAVPGFVTGCRTSSRWPARRPRSA